MTITAKYATATASLDLSKEATRLLEWTGTNAEDDIAALRSGTMTPDALLRDCLNGCESEADRETWREYVDEVVRVAGQTQAARS